MALSRAVAALHRRDELQPWRLFLCANPSPPYLLMCGSDHGVFEGLWSFADIQIVDCVDGSRCKAEGAAVDSDDFAHGDEHNFWVELQLPI